MNVYHKTGLFMKMLKNYDILFVGAGLTNATIANCISHSNSLITDKLKMLVIDKRKHLGGNCYTNRKNGIDVHTYGAHIFHTSNEDVYRFVNLFGEWKSFINQPIAIYTNKFGTKHAYNMPFNMNTFVQLFPGCTTPDEVKNRIDAEITEANITKPSNLAEQAISMVGTTIYHTLIEGYTKKQWGRPCEELPPDIIKRLPVRFTFDNNYFNDKYQMIPVDGYSSIINAMFDDVANRLDVNLGMSYKKLLKTGIKAKVVFYSGGIDEFYDYKFGALEYRSVNFETYEYKSPSDANVQGCPVCNYTSTDVPYTRSIEHKWFCPRPESNGTIVSYEYSTEWRKGMEPYYPVNNDKNQALYEKYVEYHKEQQLKSKTKVIFVGRLGKYRYMDMDDCIADAFDVVSYYESQFAAK